MASKIRTGIKIGQEDNFLLQHLSIHQSINDHHTFEMHCALREQPDYLLEVAQKAIGEEIEVTIEGARISDSRKNYFSGIVTSVSLSKQLGGHDEIIFEGYSHTVKMDDGPHFQSYTDKTLKDIIQSVADKHGVEVKIEGNYHTKVLPYQVQYRETGFDFLNRLANTYGEWFFFNGTDLYFGKAPKEESISLQFGKELFSFDLDLNARPPNFKLLGYDYMGHDFPESQAEKVKVAGLDDYGKLVADKSEQIYATEPVMAIQQNIEDKSDLDTYVAYRKQASAAHYVIFNGTSDSHELNLGSIIKVFGKQMSKANVDMQYGTFRIIGITHNVDGTGGYKNHFLAVSADLECPPSTNKVKTPMAEIQPAKVVDNHDPDQLGRIKVQFQWQQATGDETPWIRVAASGAGGSHGAYFVPEKDDQILIAFEYDNPNRPYALGSLYHGKAKPDGVADPENFKKVIKTRSGNQIYLSDEGGEEEIKIENGTNVIVLSLSGSGSISITSAGDISLSAKNITIAAEEKLDMTCENLSIDAKTEAKLTSDKITAEADSSVAISSPKNISIAGTVKTSIGEGSTASELKGKTVTIEGVMMTEVKGAMVKLN